MQPSKFVMLGRTGVVHINEFISNPCIHTTYCYFIIYFFIFSSSLILITHFKLIAPFPLLNTTTSPTLKCTLLVWIMMGMHYFIDNCILFYFICYIHNYCSTAAIGVGGKQIVGDKLLPGWRKPYV